MPRFVAFLRGINVGGHRVTNDALCALVEDLGFADVDAYRASGNVVLTADERPVADLRVRLEEGLAEGLGYAVPTFLRTPDEVRAIADHEPFAAQHVEASHGSLQVAMLAEEPAAADRDAVLDMATDRDRLAVRGRELYWLPSGGTTDSELDWDAIEDLLGPTTTRTKNTVARIAAKYFRG